MTEDAAEPADSEGEERDNIGGFLTSLLVMIAVLVAVEIFYRTSTLDQKLRKGWVFTAKQLEYETVGGDVVFTGNSRMYHAIRPKVIEGALAAAGKPATVYNFGIPSGTSPMFLMVAHQLAHHKPAPKIFVIGMSPVLSSCCDELGLAGARSGMSWPLVPAFLRAGWFTSTEDAGMAVFLGASHMLAGRLEILYTIKASTIQAPSTFHDKGWYSMGGRVDPATQEYRAKGRSVPYAESMDKSKGAVIRPTVHRYLAEAIEVLQKAHVKVILMGAPQARQMNWYHDEKHVYFEYLAEMKKLSDKYGVPFVDMNDPPVIQPTDFVDGDHLSDPGSEAFSKYLADEVIQRYLP